MKLYNLLKIPKFTWSLLGLVTVWAIWTELVLFEYKIGISYLIFNILLLTPLIYLIILKQHQNRYAKFILLVILALTIDVFYYNNDFVRLFLPFIITILIFILYKSIMCRCQEFYQQFFSNFHIFPKSINLVALFIKNLVNVDSNQKIYERVIIGIAITVPFLILFAALFSSIDPNFKSFMKAIFVFNLKTSIMTFFKIAILAIIFLTIVVVSFSTRVELSEVDIKKQKGLDIVIVGIFLGMINLLFFTFIIFQMQYFFGGVEFIKSSGINYAQYARSGFFELLIVISLASLILLYIYKRLSASTHQLLIKLFQILLASQVLLIALSSLNKMYIYQNMFGGSTLRYYVEWFTYFLTILLILFISFLIYKKSFYRFLNYLSIFSLVALVMVSSINIDNLIANNHIKRLYSIKYANFTLDYRYLATLSIDAIEAFETDKIDKSKLTGHDRRSRKFFTWESRVKKQRDCSNILEFHLGYCIKKIQLNKE